MRFAIFISALIIAEQLHQIPCVLGFMTDFGAVRCGVLLLIGACFLWADVWDFFRK